MHAGSPEQQSGTGDQLRREQRRPHTRHQLERLRTDVLPQGDPGYRIPSFHGVAPERTTSGAAVRDAQLDAARTQRRGTAPPSGSCSNKRDAI